MDAKTSEQTNGPHNRKKNIRTPFSRPPLVVSWISGRRSRTFFTGFSHDESSGEEKKRRDGRAFRGRRSGVYVIAGWWTLVYLRKRAKQAPFLLLALSSSHYPSSLSLIKAAPLFIKFHERNRVTCNRGGKKKMKKRLRSEQPLRDWALKNVDDKKVLASFIYFFRNETSFREITREIFLLGLMFNEMSFSINMYVQFGSI